MHPVQHTEDPTPTHLGEEWRSDLQEEFGTFDWGHPRGRGYSIKFRRVPAQLGIRASKNQAGGYSTEFQYGITIFRALRWYLEQLQWVSQRGDRAGTTWIELAIDFEQATAVPLQMPNHQGDELNLQRKAKLLSTAARRLARICGVAGPHPGPPTLPESSGHCHDGRPPCSQGGQGDTCHEESVPDSHAGAGRICV